MANRFRPELNQYLQNGDLTNITAAGNMVLNSVWYRNWEDPVHADGRNNHYVTYLWIDKWPVVGEKPLEELTFEEFLRSIIYVGSGDAGRPYEHVAMAFHTHDPARVAPFRYAARMVPFHQSMKTSSDANRPFNLLILPNVVNKIAQDREAAMLVALGDSGQRKNVDAAGQLYNGNGGQQRSFIELKNTHPSNNYNKYLAAEESMERYAYFGVSCLIFAHQRMQAPSLKVIPQYG
ncbi:hypothetical protein Ddc_21404 [Ditylenchus destructor]|nr:hypothetical protein Ddc_21404 [Ditylenchus destructor]